MGSDHSFDLVAAMRFDPREGVADLDRHLARLGGSAEALGFAFDRHEARNELQAATFRAGPARVRLMLARSGVLAIELRPLDPPPAEPVAVAIAALPLAADDPRLLHRTSDTAALDAAREAAGTFEAVFLDEQGRPWGGSFTSLFVERGGGLLTPPGRAGILRDRLIGEERAREAALTKSDLEGGFLIGNSLLGLVRARLA